MLVHEFSPGSFAPWQGQPVNGVWYPRNIEQLWPPAELATVGLFAFVPFVKPPDTHLAGNRRWERIDGVVQELYDTVPWTAEEIAERDRRLAFKADAIRQDMIDRLTSATPQQISDYVDANVIDLASARTMLKRIIFVLATAIRE